MRSSDLTLEAVRNGRTTAAQIRDYTKLRHDEQNKILYQLERDGLIYNIGRGKWIANNQLENQ